MNWDFCGIQGFPLQLRCRGVNLSSNVPEWLKVTQRGWALQAMVTQRADEDALLFLHSSNIISAHFSVNTSFFLNSCCNLVEFKWLAATEVNKIHQYRPAEACASILFKPYKSPRPLLFCNNQEGKSFILDFFLNNDLLPRSSQVVHIFLLLHLVQDSNQIFHWHFESMWLCKIFPAQAEVLL